MVQQSPRKSNYPPNLKMFDATRESIESIKNVSKVVVRLPSKTEPGTPNSRSRI